MEFIWGFHNFHIYLECILNLYKMLIKFEPTQYYYKLLQLTKPFQLQRSLFEILLKKNTAIFIVAFN